MKKKTPRNRVQYLSGLVLFCVFALFSCRTPGGRQQDTADTPAVPDARETPHESPRESPAPAEDAPPVQPGPEDFAETRPPVTVRDELVVTFSKTELEFDFRKSYMAAEAQLFTALYEGLFSYHPMTMEPVRGAAESWELSDDKKQWTCTIRENARYWTGDTVKAEDFRTAWISLLDPARESPYSSLFDIIAGAREYRTGTISDPSLVG
ncbi:MAG: ABC transporter substrate-binding protein, partial [Treponema sp.]|nr:ABC transporter substrate-binding protein [Treponema sp.]